jgi:hypothetical protein
VTRFSEKLDSQGGELTLKVQLAAHVVRNFRGFNADRVTYISDRDETELQKELLRKPYAFVAVEGADGGVTMVNRLQFACRIAELAVARI